MFIPKIWKYAVVLLMMSMPASLRARQSDIRINVNSRSAGSHPAIRAAAYLNGYKRTVSGQTINYHSSHPDAEAALIVRAQSDVHAIAWETDSLRNPAGEEFVTFIWLAATCSTKASASFI